MPRYDVLDDPTRRRPAVDGQRPDRDAAGTPRAGSVGTRLFDRVARFSLRRRRLVLVAAGAATVVAGVVGATASAHLSQGGFDAPGEQAIRAETVLQDQLHQGAPNLVLLVTARHGTVDTPAVVRAGQALAHHLAAQPHVADVESYWTQDRLPALRSRDDRQAIVTARILGDQDQMAAREPAVVRSLPRADAAIRVAVGGFAPTFGEVDTVVERGLITAELIAVPITFVVLLFVYGSLVAAALPLVVGGASVLGTLFVLRVLALVTPVSVYAENLTTALGLGLAIDYSLFMVSRFREELATGHPPDEAVRRATVQAGRTVAASAVTVAASLAVLLVFPMMFLRSFAFAGIPVALLSGAVAVVVLPAVLGTLGHRVDALAVWRPSLRPVDHGFWSRLAGAVMRRPVVFLVGSVAVLVVLGSPFLGLRLGYLDYRVLPPGNPVRQVDDATARQFGQGGLGTLAVVAPRVGAPAGSPARIRAVDAYALRLSRLPGVQMVAASTGVFFRGVALPAPADYTAQFDGAAGTWLAVTPGVQPLGPAGTRLVQAVRAAPSPFPVLVGGLPAEDVDSVHAITARLPLALALMAIVSFAVLLVMFASVLIPLKALVMNVLSLSATFGAMVWIFQDGHGSSLLGFTATGSLLAAMPLLMFCVAFGLSMDYEVFLMSRIREQHDAGAGNVTAVATGLQRTGRIVTAAALTMAIVFLAQATSGISFIKMFGLGLTLAVLVDAFLVRGMLVPAVMRLAGNANWWLPGPLRRRLGPAGPPSA